MTSDHWSLVERLQKAREGSPELSAAVGKWAHVEPVEVTCPATGASFHELPPFSQSMDAALLLVMPTTRFELRRERSNKGVGWHAFCDRTVARGATPALATCAAAVMCRGEHGHAWLGFEKENAPDAAAHIRDQDKGIRMMMAKGLMAEWGTSISLLPDYRIVVDAPDAVASLCNLCVEELRVELHRREQEVAA